ncbi:YkgJ family cysteine cluster protein [Alkalimarinus sediminis]|uniref:YkgJ family cysteine cluster protein n=1 Tax=Alkalimarinus sediminis TaxID=1632866 RepID=A0A9E8HKS5_9ALTE|nr:YkgJ family cysteine cluster protein [Alkalimarinus sediminis]UZW75162.1 YkgJ family cysteine cluster protein [Alkalimarinus sediminis]
MKACNSCGKCCIKYGDGDLSASKMDIDMWELFRPDIYRYVHNNEIWFDPETKQPLTRCPWLKEAPEQESGKMRYSCDIYLDRPEDCRHYPSLIEEMRRDECEMLEPHDLIKPRQAQRKLDIIMSDSRPPAFFE